MDTAGVTQTRKKTMEPGTELRNVESMSTEPRNEQRVRSNEPEKEWSALFFLNRFLNFLLVSFFITPLIVSYWRGTWYILDSFVFPNDQFLSYWVSWAAGFGVIYFIVLVEDYLKKFLNERKAKKVLYLTLFYPLSFLIVNSWRGLWMLLDYYTTASLTSGCVSHAVGFFIVLSMKATSSIIALPGYCSSDSNVDLSLNILERKNCFEIKKFRRWISDKVSAITTRMLNSFVTVFVIGSGVICYWRGTWIIVASIKPGDKLMSSIIALSLGFAICSICYCLGEVIATKKLNPPYRWWVRVLEGMFVYFLGFGVVSIWVGLWFLEDIYLFPDKQITSALVCHFVGIAGLYMLQETINLIGSPAGCRIHHGNKLEGLDMGSYLKRESERNDVRNNKVFPEAETEKH